MAKKHGRGKKNAPSTPSFPLDRALFYGALFLVFALPLFIWPGISEYGYGKTIVALIGVSILTVLWGLSGWQKGAWTIRLPWLTLPVLGLIAVSLLSLLHATNGRVVVQSLVLVVYFAVLVLVIASAVRDQRDVNLLLLALLASAFLVALYGLLQYLGVMRGPGGKSGLEQIISTMGNRNYVGGFLSYLLFPATVLIFRLRSRWMRLLSVLLIAFCFGMVLIVTQTGTLAALILGSVALLVGLLIFRPIEPIRRNRTWLLILIGALALTFLIEAPPSPVSSLVGLSAEETASTDGNLILNPGFEDGARFWGSTGSLEEQGGDASESWWKIERQGENRGNWQQDVQGSMRLIPVQSGTNYEVEAAILSDGRATAAVCIHFYDEAKTRLSSVEAGRTTSRAWKGVEKMFTVPSSASFAAVQLVALGEDGWAGFDNLSLRRIGQIQAWIRQLWARNAGSIRSWDWWIGWEMFADHPITGVGLGNYKLNFLPYKAGFLATPRGEAYDFYIDRAAQAHNEYVQVLAELGILGVLALASFFAILVVSLWKRLRSNDETNRLDLLLFSCGIVAFLVHALVSFPAHLPASSLVFIVVVGLALSRVYGDSGQTCIKLVGWRLKTVLAGVALIGLIVSVVAGRDLAANLLMNKGIEQTQLGNYYGAESLLERSIELDFAPRQTYYHLAVVQIERGAYDEAQENLEKCFTRFVDETVYLNYATLTTNSRQFDLAYEAIELLLASHPREEIAVRARYLEAIIVAQAGNPREATSLLKALILDAPQFESAYIGLGTIYEMQGLTVNAREAYEMALELIEDKLEKAQESLNSQTTITAEEFGRLRSEIEQLQQSRETVLDKLEDLSAAESP